MYSRTCAAVSSAYMCAAFSLEDHFVLYREIYDSSCTHGLNLFARAKSMHVFRVFLSTRNGILHFYKVLLNVSQKGLSPYCTRNISHIR